MDKPRLVLSDAKAAELRVLVERQRTLESVPVPELRVPATPAERAVLAVINCMDGIEIPDILLNCSHVFHGKAIEIAISQLLREEAIYAPAMTNKRAKGGASLTPKGREIVETLQSKGKI